MRKLLRNCVRFSCAVVMAIGFVVAPPTVAHATKYWRNGVVTGNWNVPTNWSSISAADTTTSGVPTAGEAVNIVNTDGTARTVTYDVNAPSLGLVTINLTGGGAATNTLSIPNNNSLSANAIFVGGYTGTGPTTGRGAINQTAGTVTINSGTDFVLGHGAGSTGTYTLGGTGALVANQSQYIGFSGTGIFNQSGGTNTINDSAVGTLVLGNSAGASGTYNLSGGNFFSSSSEFIGNGGTGTFNQTGGFHNIVGDLYLGNLASGTGTYTISAGQVNVFNAFVGNAGTGTFTVQGTGIANISGLDIKATSAVNVNGGTLRLSTVTLGSLSRINWNAGKISLSGDRDLFADNVAASLFGFDGITTGQHGEVQGVASVNGGSPLAVFDIKDGGIFTSEEGRIGDEEFGQGTVNVTGPGSAWFLSSVGYLIVGGAGIHAELNVRNGGLVYGEINLVADTNGTINLDGGTIRFYELNEFGGDGVFNFKSGTLQLAGNRTIGPDPTINRIFNGAPTLTSGKELSIEGAATLETVVTLDGGTFTAPSIVNGQNLSLLRGRLHITNQAVTIGSGGLLGSTLDLNDDMTINVNQGITNQGLVAGDGQIGGNFTNAAAGELRAEPGKSLKLTGISTNSGRITLYGGMLEFTSNLSNNTGAFISGNGTLKANQLNNSGTMNFAGTANILGNVINASGGKVISGGGGATIFYGDVTNNGEIRTSTNGFTVFFGAATGSGTYTGTGTVNFEGDLSPGSSPGAVNFAGDVIFGPAATLEIEIGGLAAGTQHDQINVAGKLTLDGTLAVTLINGFTPSAGQSFDILNAGILAGAFASLDLPTLPGLAWNTSQLSTGIVSVVAAALPGDFNNNGTVDAADYVVWRKGVLVAPTQANYDLWRSHFGQTAGSGSSSAFPPPPSALGAAVPEPAAIVILLAQTLLMSCHRRAIPQVLVRHNWEVF